MKIIKRIVIGFLLFSVSFSLMFLLTDKTEHYTVDTYVEEPGVYVTEYGDCYHSYDCHYLSQSMIEKGLYHALSQGYRACSYCGGIPRETVEVYYGETKSKDLTNAVAMKSFIFASVSVMIYISICMMIYISNKKDE